MSLDDSERLMTLMLSIKSLKGYARKLSLEDYTCNYNSISFENRALITELREYVDSLWHAYLGLSLTLPKNQSFWNFKIDDYGESVTDLDIGKPLATALHLHFERFRVPVRELSDSEFEFHHFCDEKWHEAIIQVYFEAQYMLKIISSDDDQIAKILTPLSKLTSSIQGTCFEVFESNNAFATAFLRKELSLVILKRPSHASVEPYHKIVNQPHFKIALKQGLKDLCLEQLIKYHSGWVCSSKTNRDRVTLWFDIVGRHASTSSRLVEDFISLGMDRDYLQGLLKKARKLESEEQLGLKKDEALKSEHQSKFIHGNISWQKKSNKPSSKVRLDSFKEKLYYPGLEWSLNDE